MEIIIHPTINHNQLVFARKYRGYTQTELAKNIKGLSQANLSKFEKGFKTISIDKVREIMTFLDFPFDFLFREVKQVKYC